jgi:MFS transporter, ENTS family, enterobactin (siderophore) exporter
MRIGQIVIDVTPLRESRDFRWLFTGRLASMVGNALATAAANWQVYGLTHSSLAVGLVSLADSAGMLVGLMAGGVLADRHDRRKLLTVVRIPQALLAVLLMINSLLGHPALWPIYVITLAIGLAAGLSSPASTAAGPALVGPGRLAAAAALNSMSGQLANLGGPALAGALIAGPGLAVCYAIDAVGFAVFGIAVHFVRPLPPAPGGQRPGLQALAEGFRYVRRNGVIGGMLLIDTSAMIFGMPSGLFPALATEHFHGGPATFGLLTAAPAAGAIIGAATSGWTSHVRRPGLVVIGAGMLWGASIVGFGLASSLLIGLAFLALAGMSDLISEVLRNALLQHYTPDQLRGRVSSLYLAQVNSAPALGNVEAGGVAQLFSLTTSVVSGGLACVAGALLLGSLIPAVRHASLRLPGEDQPSGEGPVPGGAQPSGAGPVPGAELSRPGPCTPKRHVVDIDKDAADDEPTAVRHLW